MRYVARTRPEAESAEEMMARYSLSRRTLFRNLEMLRRRLHDCVSQQLKAEGFA